MSGRPIWFTLLLAGCLISNWAAPAQAAPEEIQVYQDELSAPGEFGLDIHANYVAQGDRGLDYSGQQSGVHRWRMTPELSLGLGHGFEAGFYFPLATVAPGQPFYTNGVKARLKWLAPHQDQGLYWGANLELGRVAHRLDINPWNGELKLIGGWRRGPWQIGVNGNFGFVVSGPQHDPIETQLATKVSYQLKPGLTLGVENYNGAGALRDPGHFAAQDQASFLTIDTRLGKWDVNAGIGHGYGSNPDHLILKFIIGVPFGRGS